VNQITNKPETWLVCIAGFAACKVCHSYTGQIRKDTFAQGTGSFDRFGNILKHGNGNPAQQQALSKTYGPRQGINWGHVLAIQQWCQKMLFSLAPVSIPSVVGSAAQDVRHMFMILRTMLETRGSFLSVGSWVAAAQFGQSGAQKVNDKQLKKSLHTMASYEGFTTRMLLRNGSAFRLQADGRKRVYQVEIGAVLWKFPDCLQYQRGDLEKGGGISCLGERGPWIVERLIGMREFPNEMDTDGKASMVEAALRNTAVKPGGEVDGDLHQHMKRNTKVWTSDGADLDVGLALAGGGFKGLVLHAWDEAHSSVRLLANAMKYDAEIVVVDCLLVSGKKPYALAKFVSTSDVFRKKVGDAQADAGVSFVRNFGWAPQRYQSKARPYKRQARRWDPIWAAVAAEAAGKNRDRRQLAEYLLESLGGQNSYRLVIGGLLADLTAEHYTWVATGDESNPDTATVMDRKDCFAHRLDVLFIQGHIFKLPETYTGATLEYLKENHYYHHGTKVTVFGIGELTDPETREQMRRALQHVQGVVKNIIELFKVYRSESSWLALFTAFRLPSPRGCISCQEKLQCVIAQTKLQLPKLTLSEWQKLLPRAEALQKQGCSTRESWGQASAEFPELKNGRLLVEVFLVWKTSTGNLERRFRTYSEVMTLQRASLLHTTAETMMLADQAPPSDKLLDTKGDKKTDYLSELQLWHGGLHPVIRERGANGKQRRDAGVPRTIAADEAPTTEAAFSRKREAAIAAAVSASPRKRARMAPEMNWVQQDDDREVMAASKCVEAVAKRTQQQARKTAAKAAAKREDQVVRSSLQPALDLKDVPPLPAGILLALPKEEQARRKASRLGFKLVQDPVEFVYEVGRQAISSRTGHVVVAPAAGDSDYAVCARIAAVIMGAWYTDAKHFISAGRTSGCQYEELVRQSKFRLAVSADLQERCPSVVLLMRAIAQNPRSTCELYSVRKLTKEYCKQQKEQKRNNKRGNSSAVNWFILSIEGENLKIDKKKRVLYQTVPEFIRRICKANKEAVCPGHPEQK